MIFGTIKRETYNQEINEKMVLQLQQLQVT